MKNSINHQSITKNLRSVFFGTPDFAVIILDELEKVGILPTLIVTNPDRPKGRNLVLTPPPVKVWAQKRNIPFIQPETLKDHTLIDKLRKDRWDIFMVASYGKIIPKEIIDLPLHNTLNVHPSLLPKFRGPSPIHGAVLADEKKTGISIMVIDEEMDHGPILAQEIYEVKEWPPMEKLERDMGHAGGALLARVIPEWIERNIEAKPQEHHLATYTKKVSKADGLIDLTADPYLTFRKIQAYDGWPGTYFFTEKNGVKTRVIIKKAHFDNGVLAIDRVLPEGKSEIDYQQFLKTS